MKSNLLRKLSAPFRGAEEEQTSPTPSPRSDNHRGVCFPLGFKANGVASGIKPHGLDLALVTSDFPAVAAAVFTTNLVKAAPIKVSQAHVESGKAQAVIISSGNANAATGDEGLETARKMCEAAALGLGIEKELVLIAQTGLIGKQLDRNTALSGVVHALNDLSPEGGDLAAQAIMTTDTRTKISERTLRVGSDWVRIGGMAKGAAMLSPSMATMLAVVTTDANVKPNVLHHALTRAVDESFHCVVVDGCRSTNDTVFLLANGMSGSKEIDSLLHPDYQAFEANLTAVCQDLAKQMAKDAEGGTKFLTVNVTGARSVFDARRAAHAVARSTLVKCSLAGENLYWGRVLAELGASGATFAPENVEIAYGNFVVCKGGLECSYDSASAQMCMKGRDIVINVTLGSGPGSAFAYGSDLTHAYVDENMGAS